MLTREENDLLTQVGPGTPGGALMRRYWQPVALSSEIPPGSAPLPVRLLGEDLVLFRDQFDRIGLLGIHCAHRAADLSYARIEDGGLRCLYHGWLYDIHGNCLEQPGEPEGSTFKDKVQHLAYPAAERGDLVFAYLGGGEPPSLPPYEAFDVPSEQRSVYKVFQDCNYLQGNEGNIDPQHLSFLHRLSRPGDLNQTLNTQVTAPHLELEDTDFGIRIYAVRKVDEENTYVRVTNFVMPNLAAVAGDAEGYSINWHVPIDDTHHWRYGIRFNRTQPIRPQQNARSEEIGEDFRLIRNESNRYLQDRESMKSRAFIGMGPNFVVHDTWATQGEGAIQNRTTEHLGYTDMAIAAARRMLLKAVRDVQEGQDPLHVIRDSEKRSEDLGIYVRNDIVLPSSADWHRYWENDAVRELATSTHR